MPKIDIAIPDKFLCPITRELMIWPVATVDRQIYERQAIESWLKENNTNPITGIALKSRKLTDSYATERDIKKFFEKNNICSFDDFLSAACTEYVKFVENLSYIDAHFKATRSFSGYTALHSAATMGDPETIEFLLKNGMEVNTKGRIGYTALHLASARGNAEVIAILLMNGANPETKNECSETPLFSAATQEIREFMVEMIKMKSTIDEKQKKIEELESELRKVASNISQN